VEQLAARYPFEPAQAQQICKDLYYTIPAQDAPLTLSDVAAAVRSRTSGSLSGGIQLIHPEADWSQLVLPELLMAQLQDAANRLFLQSRVLDDWHFLKGRRGARGVRMLFSGPPGTGKTLSAEVMAKSLGVDLLQVDLSRVVSKWIGETEKNLAEIFLTAESTKAVLFFDEADALFGKRTEVSDAHDRYANLETAYLLSRLERYDGLAILATNYRQNIDSAFSRRLEFIIEFEEPGVNERLTLWQCHIPSLAPLQDDVNLNELAALYPIVGGHIRNAAVAAAFLAAQDDGGIKQQHFVDAIRREYQKSGKAYREVSVR
jgi:SpoVK/Ycf46/Vps4 family AAA+-type ATPase